MPLSLNRLGAWRFDALGWKLATSNHSLKNRQYSNQQSNTGDGPLPPSRRPRVDLATYAEDVRSLRTPWQMPVLVHLPSTLKGNVEYSEQQRPLNFSGLRTRQDTTPWTQSSLFSPFIRTPSDPIASSSRRGLHSAAEETLEDHEESTPSGVKSSEAQRPDYNPGYEILAFCLETGDWEGAATELSHVQPTADVLEATLAILDYRFHIKGSGSRSRDDLFKRLRELASTSSVSFTSDLRRRYLATMARYAVALEAEEQDRKQTIQRIASATDSTSTHVDKMTLLYTPGGEASVIDVATAKELLFDLQSQPYLVPQVLSDLQQHCQVAAKQKGNLDVGTWELLLKAFSEAGHLDGCAIAIEGAANKGMDMSVCSGYKVRTIGRTVEQDRDAALRSLVAVRQSVAGSQYSTDAVEAFMSETLESYSRLGDLASAEDVLKHMAENKLSPKSSAFLQFIQACFKSQKDPEIIFQYIEDVMKRGALPDSNSVLSHTLDRFSLRTQNFDAAYRLAALMLGERQVPDAVTMARLAWRGVQEDSFEEASEFLLIFSQKRLEPALLRHILLSSDFMFRDTLGSTINALIECGKALHVRDLALSLVAQVSHTPTTQKLLHLISPSLEAVANAIKDDFAALHQFWVEVRSACSLDSVNALLLRAYLQQLGDDSTLAREDFQSLILDAISCPELESAEKRAVVDKLRNEMSARGVILPLSVQEAISQAFGNTQPSHVTEIPPGGGQKDDHTMSALNDYDISSLSKSSQSTKYTYNSRTDLGQKLEYAARKGQMGVAKAIYREYLSRGEIPKLRVVAMVLTMFGRQRQLANAAEIFELTRRHILKYKVDVMGRLKQLHILYCLIIRSCASGLDIDKAMEYYKKMKEEVNQSPDLRTFLVLLQNSNYARGHIDPFEQVYEDLQVTPETIDAKCYNIMMSQRLNRADYDTMKKLFHRMEQTGVPYTSVSYSILISAELRQDKLEGALELFEKMVASVKVFESPAAMNNIIQFLIRKRESSKEALAFYDRVTQAYPDMKPSPFTYRLLFEGLCTTPPYDISKAIQLLQDLASKQGVALQQVPFTIILHGCGLLQRNTTMARDIFWVVMAKRYRVKPDSTCMHKMVEVGVFNNEFYEAEKVIQLVRGMIFRPMTSNEHTAERIAAIAQAMYFNLLSFLLKWTPESCRELKSPFGTPPKLPPPPREIPDVLEAGPIAVKRQLIRWMTDMTRLSTQKRSSEPEVTTPDVDESEDAGLTDSLELPDGEEISGSDSAVDVYKNDPIRPTGYTAVKIRITDQSKWMDIVQRIQSEDIPLNAEDPSSELAINQRKKLWSLIEDLVEARRGPSDR